MNPGLEAPPDDIETLKAALIVARAEAAAARAQQSDDQALIAHLKLQIEKLNRDRFGPRSERTARLLDQLELTLEELESSATEDELAAEMAAARTASATTKVASFTRKRPSRKPFPDHLPRERVVVPGPMACACCGGERLSKLGEDITETLEVIPKSWKVIQRWSPIACCWPSPPGLPWFWALIAIHPPIIVTFPTSLNCERSVEHITVIATALLNVCFQRDSVAKVFWG